LHYDGAPLRIQDAEMVQAFRSLRNRCLLDRNGIAL